MRIRRAIIAHRLWRFVSNSLHSVWTRHFSPNGRLSGCGKLLFARSFELRAEDFLQISGADWLKNIESRVTGRSPLIIRAEFRVPGIKSVIVKRIFVHWADRSSSQHMQAILSEHLVGGPLLGVLEAGITGVPGVKDLNAILDQLEPNAWYIHEMREDEFNRGGIQDLSTEINQYLNREDLDLEATVPYEIKLGDKASMVALRLRRRL